MLNHKKALLLIGSPKKKNSTSEALGNYLLQGLNKQGYTGDKLHILSMLKNNSEEFLEKINSADVLIIAFPLYVDSLPSSVIRAFELITNDRRLRKTDTKQSLTVIVNNGFPEAIQNDTAIRICKSFADKNNFKWLGGLAMGGGGAINGKSVKQLGGLTRNIVKALDMAAETIVKDEAFPKEVIELMSSKLFPVWLYTFFGNRGWITQAKQFNAHRELHAKPYVKEE